LMALWRCCHSFGVGAVCSGNPSSRTEKVKMSGSLLEAQ
jgi:hypothetical protein